MDVVDALYRLGTVDATCSPAKPVTLLGTTLGLMGLLDRLHVVTRVFLGWPFALLGVHALVRGELRARAIAVNVVRGSASPMT